MKKNIFKNSGFTILETMIAVSLFIVVVMVGMNALLNTNVINQKSQSLRSIMDNLSFIMEDMSKNLRTGYHYQCFRRGVDTTLSSGTLGSPRSCADGWALSFEPAGGSTASNADQVAYSLSGGKIFKSIDGITTAMIQLTPDEVVINSISSFSVLGAEPPAGNKQQPLVTIRLIGTITVKNVVTPFYLQTSVSQRFIDV